MLHTLEIEDICKIDVSSEIRLPVIRIEFQMPRQCTRTTFFLPSETEKVVSFLEDISKDKTIDHAFTLTMNTEKVNGGGVGGGRVNPQNEVCLIDIDNDGGDW